jgi:hypothetical protein
MIFKNKYALNQPNMKQLHFFKKHFGKICLKYFLAAIAIAFCFCAQAQIKILVVKPKSKDGLLVTPGSKGMQHAVAPLNPTPKPSPPHSRPTEPNNVKRVVAKPKPVLLTTPFQ